MKTIKINGGNYPFAFTIMAGRLFNTETGKKWEEAIADISTGDMGILMWCGLREGGVRADKEFELSIGQVEIAISDKEGGVLEAMETLTHDLEMFTKSLTKKKVAKK